MEFFDWEGERKWADHRMWDVQYRERKSRGDHGLLKRPYEAEGDVFTTMSWAAFTAMSTALFRW